MRKLLFLIVTIFFFRNAHSKPIVLKINGNDCINCVKILDYLQKEINSDRHKFLCIFGDEFRKNGKEISKRFTLDKFKNFELIFSDSLYEKYSTIAGSEIYILSKVNSKIFRSDFTNLDAAVFRLALESPETDRGEIMIPLNNEMSGGDFNFYGTHNFLAVMQNGGRESIYDVYRNNVQTVDLTSEETDICYQTLFNSKAKSIQATLKNLRSKGERGLLPHATNLYIKNDSTILCVFLIPFVETAGVDTIIDSKYLLTQYNIRTKKHTQFKQYPILKDSDEYRLGSKLFYHGNLGFLYLPIIKKARVNIILRKPQAILARLR